MDILERKIPVRDIIEDYVDESNTEGPIVGYKGNLNIRPAYQRNFVYNTEQSRKVIETILNGFPLNIIYFVSDDDKKYELLDGQQRIISIAKFYEGDFSIKREENYFFFKNLTKEEQETFLNYPLNIYVCMNGTDREKLDWFEVINTAGEKLNPQEIRNAIYHGTWCSDAKKYFSKRNGPAVSLGEKYMSGDANRQDYLETIIKWISNNDIVNYMAKHQHDETANELWTYYRKIIDWINLLFVDYYPKMKGLAWGELYNKYAKNDYNSDKIAIEVKELYEDPYVTDKSGIFEYVLTDHSVEKLKLLNVRVFDDKVKQITYNKQKGICPICKSAGIDRVYEINEMEADHITAWSKGGSTEAENCQMLCQTHNRAKGNR